MDPERQQAWTRYWQSGALHSCVGSYDGNYGGAVAAFWRARFAGLDADMRVLDLGTGNGPLPALMLEALGAAAMPQVDAVDLANPRPDWHGRLDAAVAGRIHFRGGVAMESLPFPDRRFDRIVSQFGFEYAEREAATAELLRVLAADGEVALVCHHAGSRLAQVAAEELAHSDHLLGDDGVLAALDGLLPFAARTASAAGAAAMRKDPSALAARDRFNQVMASTMARAERSAVPDALHDAANTCGHILKLAATQGAGAGHAAVQGWAGAARDARLRSQELITHALDEAAADDLAGALRAGGREVRTAELHEGDYLLGWTVTAASR